MSNCNCKSEIEAQLTENFKKRVPAASSHRVELQGYGFGIINNTMVMRPFMEYRASAEHPNKKGGAPRLKAVKGNMIFSFCPFCGQKTVKDGL